MCRNLKTNLDKNNFAIKLFQRCISSKSTLEKTKGVIKKGQSRDTGNIGYKNGQSRDTGNIGQTKQN